VRKWHTPSGRAQFIVAASLGETAFPTDSVLLRLATIRSHDQYNTTIYSLNDRYRGVFAGRTVVFMNAADMRRRGIAPATRVEIESVAADGRRRVLRDFTAHPYDIPEGSVAAYYPETNALLPLAYHDPKSKTPAAKSIPVFITAQEVGP
jgi:anaerobic selenocysteine-containing dehydrogenase